MLTLWIVPHGMSAYSEAVFDVLLLTLLSIPPIYVWVIKPFVIARDASLAQIDHLAHTDPLTQLANRRLLLRYLGKFLSSSLRHKFHGGLLLMDLDGFKLVNDVHGHDAGDAVLVEIAQRLQSDVRSEDVVARLGGDEFAVLLGYLDADKQIAHDKALGIAEKLISLVSQPFYFDGGTLRVGASIGVRLLGFEDLDTETALREADIAMYRAKQAGGGCAVIFGKSN